MKKFNNNKGFSLVELIASVFILAIVVVPLLHAFTLSTRTVNRSRSLGESTAAAQNVQEAIEAFSIDEIKGSDARFLGMLKADNYEIRPNGEVWITGVPTGTGKCDATVTFDGSSGLVQNINSKEISKYSKLNASFAQPLDRNPDVISSNTYKAINSDSSDKERRRVIYIDISSHEDEDTGEIKVNTTVTFQYHYKESCRYYNNILNGVTDTCYFQQYELDEATISSYDEDFTFRLLYYPFFEYRGTSRPYDTVFLITDVGNDRGIGSQLKVNLVLVKMYPMIENDDGWKTITQLESSTLRVPGTDYNNDGVDETSFLTADQNYHLDVYEVHPRSYESLEYHMDSAGNWINSVFTNAGFRIYSDSNEEMNRCINLQIMRWMNFKTVDGVNIPTMISRCRLQRNDKSSEYKNSLVNKEQDDRIFSVTINVYNEGTIESGALEGNEEDRPNPVYSMHTCKLN